MDTRGTVQDLQMLDQINIYIYSHVTIENLNSNNNNNKSNKCSNRIL